MSSWMKAVFDLWRLHLLNHMNVVINTQIVCASLLVEGERKN